MNKNDYIIRLERKEEYREVENLVRESFWNVYRPGCGEHYVIHALRDDPAFVKELDFVMCTERAPRQNVAVAKAKAQATQRNLDDAAAEQTIWSGKLQSQIVTCPVCGRPAGSGKFCQGCGANLRAKKCPNCGATLTEGVRFCGERGAKLSEE